MSQHKLTYIHFQDEDDDEEDPDARADPMYGLNLKQYLTEFLHDFCKQAWMPLINQSSLSDCVMPDFNKFWPELHLD